jgi:thioredoxin reductase (NADPH)
VLTKNVQNLVKSMSFAYRTQCTTNDVALFDAFATFVDPHTVEATQRDGSVVTLTADRFILATGGRPSYPDVPGAMEHCITSDDVFSLKASPGKTLVVGASYVALECAGFLRGLGFEVTVLMRSVPLRGFDQEMAAHIVTDLEREGVVFMRDAELVRVEAPEGSEGSGRKVASWKAPRRAAEGDAVPVPATEASDAFDTVLLAVGRDAYTQKLGLDKAGVTRNAANGKLPVRHEQTNVDHIYAIGDIIDGDALEPPSQLTELTPVAIQAGRLLAHRLYGAPGGKEMDYRMVPTTVFTPIEYGCVGYTEEDAVAEFGAENLEVFHQYYQPLEWRLVKSRGERSAFVKLLVHTADADRVVGLHVCGPHAGEMTQGFAVAMRCGATKADFDETVGIHPTSAEILTTMDVTKRSGISPKSKAC